MRKKKFLLPVVYDCVHDKKRKESLKTTKTSVNKERWQL